jgi:hypothetical protein
MVGVMACLGFAFCAASARAADTSRPGIVSHVLVLSDKCEDVSSPEAWKKTCIPDGMSDQDTAIAIWKTVVKYRHQDIPPHEFFSGGCVHDPFKTIHVYGYGMCCCASSDVEGLARYLGLQARGRSIALHSVPEIFYDDAWHTVDGSLMNYFLKPDGKIAGVDEIHKAIKDWYAASPDRQALRGKDKLLKDFSKNEGWKKGPALLASCQFYDQDGINFAGWHGWWSNMQEYHYKEPKGGFIFDYGSSMGYQLNVQLRAGEKLTRNWFNKGLHVDMDAGHKMPDKLLKGKRDALGFQRKLGDLAPGRIGNGTLEYAVPLAGGQFRQGALQADNLACTAEDRAAPALHVKDPSRSGVLVLRMPCSYVYLGGQLAAKTVVPPGGSVAVSLSDNQGLDWQQIGKFQAGGDQTLDLKKHVFNRYDYRLKFELQGAGTGLDALKISNDFQHSQAPLPTLLEGENKITFSAGVPEGTITYEPAMILDKAEGKQLSVADFHPELTDLEPNGLRPIGGKGKGQAVFKIATPGEMTRIRMNLHYRCRDLTGKDYWDVDVSFDNGVTWQKVDRFDKGQPASSKYVVFSNVPAGKKEALLRFGAGQKNTTAIFGLRMDADYKEPAGGFRPVKISYAWDEGGQPKTDVHVAKSPADAYTIHCGPHTTVKSFTVELAE